MEYWDIYDASKQPTGRKMKKNDWCLREGEYHLTVLGVVRDTAGRFLITRRVLTKAWAAGWWEVPGGAAMAGESSREAVNREVLEETGLDVSGVESVTTLTYKRENPGEGDNYFVDCYLFTLAFRAEDVKIRLEEALEWKLADAEEIKRLAQEGVFLHYDSIKQVFAAQMR